MPSTRIPCALIAERATPRIAAFNPGASPPPLTTAKVFLLLIRFLSFPQSLEIVPERAAGAGDAHGRDAFLLECRSFRKITREIPPGGSLMKSLNALQPFAL